MIRCKKTDNPYRVFANFAFDFMETLAAGEFKKAQKMIDEDHNDMFWGRVFELGVEEMETEYTHPADSEEFFIQYYQPAFDLGNEYSIEFAVPNTEMDFHAKFEFSRVRGGYRVILESI